jgi:hypothetical protein
MVKSVPGIIRHIAVVGISAPPKAGAESIQCAKWIKAYHDMGMEITLITTPVSRHGWSAEDPQLHKFQSFLKQLITKLDNRESVLHKVGSKLFPARFNFPDPHFMFASSPRKLLRELKEKPDLIYARGMPFSSALLAKSLSKMLDVPLIIHMADPFSLNPYLTGLNIEKARSLEKECFEQASMVAFTTKKMEMLYCNAFPELTDRFTVFPNVYDRDECDTDNELPAKFTLRFTGNLYGNRTLLSLFRALSSVRDECDTFEEDTELIITGRMDSGNFKLLKKHNPGFIRLEEPLPFFDSLKVQKHAHILVSIDKPATDDRDLVFLPSKLLDYMCAGRLILNISSKNSESSAFIRDNRLGETFEHDDGKGLADFIKHAYDRFLKKDFAYFTERRIAPDYESNHAARGLLNELYKRI